MGMFYILDAQGQPQEVAQRELHDWQAERRRYHLITYVCNVQVSTIFLGLNRQFGVGGPPLLFETMIFGGSENLSQWLAATVEEAQQAHDQAVARLVAEMGATEQETQYERIIAY